MTDLDHRPTLLPRKWRTALGLVQSGASEATIKRAADAALADSLRRAGGCPSLDTLAQALLHTLADPTSERWRNEKRRALQSSSRHPHVQSAVLLASCCSSAVL